MQEYYNKLRREFATGDKKRDEKNVTPEDIIRLDDISYEEYVIANAEDDELNSKAGKLCIGAEASIDEWYYVNHAVPRDGKEHFLDVYRPKDKDIAQMLPVIINVHGGGWVYGTKEIYQFYGMNMAQRGFAFVNANYRLSPKWHFPAQLVDIDAVCRFVKENADKYGFDLTRVYMVGDSAGGHLAGMYGALITNPAYNKELSEVFGAKMTSNIKINALGLNCGVYDMEADNSADNGDSADTASLHNELFPEGMNTKESRRLCSPNIHVTKDYPESYIMTANEDFLKYQAPIMKKALDFVGVKNELCVYGSDDDICYHVFHCDINNKTGQKCNSDEAEFFLLR